MAKIYTRTGDQGETSLYTPKAAATRVSKASLRVEAYGSVDELDAVIGMARAELESEHPLQTALRAIQQDLFHVGYDISTLPPNGGVPHAITADDVRRLERWIDAFEADLPRLRHFILPTGNRACAALHLARTVARRAERQVVALHAQADLSADLLTYLNRLSNLLFVMARHVQVVSGGEEEEVAWRVT